jgi:hypothetical protein
VERGWGDNSSEDARHCSVLYICKFFVLPTLVHCCAVCLSSMCIVKGLYRNFLSKGFDFALKNGVICELYFPEKYISLTSIERLAKFTLHGFLETFPFFPKTKYLAFI